MLKTPQRTAGAAIEHSAALCNVMTCIDTWIRAAYRTLDVDGFRQWRVQWLSLASARVKCRAPQNEEELHASCSLRDRHRSRRARIAGAVVGGRRTTTRRDGGVHA